MSLLLIAFIAGVLTVLAPCILPLLPVVVGGSLDNKGGVSLTRAIVVVSSLAVSIILFTLLLKASTLFIDIPERVWGYISGSIIIFFGLISLFPELWEKLPFVAKWSADSNMVLGKGFMKKSVWGDIIVGASLGPVFSTCSPTYFVILATVLPVSFALGLVYLLAYTIGLSLALLAIVFVGQKIMGKLGVAANPYGKFKRILGVLFLIVGIAIISGQDKVFERSILDNGFFDVTKVELQLLGSGTAVSPVAPPPPQTESVNAPAPSATPTQVKATMDEVLTVKAPIQIVEKNPMKKEIPLPIKLPAPVVATKTSTYKSISEKAKIYTQVPELSGIGGYINTGGNPISLADYKGKSVVLVDFWTYSCINCQRTLPYITSWYEKFKDKGLVVVGVHTPEFVFERVAKNVEDATKKWAINYPVVLDNDYATWNAFANRYWPHVYLVDINGYIVYDHIGEGNYFETEEAIKKALEERNFR